MYLNRVRDRVESLHRMQVDNGRRAWVHNLYDHDPTEGCARRLRQLAVDVGAPVRSIIGYHKLTGDRLPAIRS